MRLLVTGGAGYIGSHTCKALAAHGHLPIAYDNLVYGHPWAVRWGPLEIGDIADRQRLDQVIRQYRPEGVIHFAAYAYVGESVKDPGKYYRNNVAGSLTLLEAMRDHGIPYLVFSSTCATYGVPEQIPIPETHPQRPINPYGQSKLVVEQMLRDFPEDVILTEESGQQGSPQGAYAWMIDTLDGTTNFAHGYPFAAVSIGLLEGREPVLGVIYDIFRGDLFRAVQGMGATRNRKPIRVSSTTELSRSLLVTGFAYDRRETPDNNYAEFCHFTHLTQGVRRGGSAALDLAYVATGQLDGYWERGLSPWDIAAGIVLVREAGGKVTAYDGSPVDVYSGRLLASNGWLHAALQEELAQVSPLPVSFPMRRDRRSGEQNGQSLKIR